MAGGLGRGNKDLFSGPNRNFFYNDKNERMLPVLLSESEMMILIRAMHNNMERHDGKGYDETYRSLLERLKEDVKHHEVHTETCRRIIEKRTSDGPLPLTGSNGKSAPLNLPRAGARAVEIQPPAPHNPDHT